MYARQPSPIRVVLDSGSFKPVEKDTRYRMVRHAAPKPGSLEGVRLLVAGCPSCRQGRRLAGVPEVVVVPR